MLSVSCTTAPASLPPQLEKNLQIPTESPFKLTMSIDKELYSTVPDVINGWKQPHRQLTLDLRLHFTNHSSKVVRLDKDCVYLSSRVVYDNPVVGPSEPVLPGDGMISSQGQLCPNVASERLLAILPGGFYETPQRAKFEVVSQGPIHPPESLRPGKYFLELTMGTWWEIDGQYDELKAMRKNGVQFQLPVTSEPMWFVVVGKTLKRGVFDLDEKLFAEVLGCYP